MSFLVAFLSLRRGPLTVRARRFPPHSLAVSRIFLAALHRPCGEPREVRAHPRRVRVVRVGCQTLLQSGGEFVQVVQVLFHAVIVAAGVKPRHAIRIGGVA